MEAAEDQEPTILDRLNDDCWSVILDYVLIGNILQSERVSRQWQQVVLNYFSGIHVRLQYRRFQRGETRGRNCRVLTLDDSNPVMFDNITRKLGHGVLSSDCINEASFRSVARNCPSMEGVTISGKIETRLFWDQVENLKRLKNITFKRCRFSGVLEGKDFHADMPDVCLKEFLYNQNLEELKIYKNTQVTGQCLATLTHKIKSLYLVSCPSLQFDAIHCAVDNLRDLRKLELNGSPPEVLQNVHLLLNKMPKLEHLSLSMYSKIDLTADVMESISGLSKLHHLCLRENQNVTNDWLVAIGKGCKQLRTVDIGSRRAKHEPGFQHSLILVTVAGLMSLCSSLTDLYELSLAYNQNLSDDNVVALVSVSPNLVVLDIQGCGHLSEYLIDMIQRAVQEWPQRLRLCLYKAVTGDTGEEEIHKGLILDFNPREWRLQEY